MAEGNAFEALLSGGENEDVEAQPFTQGVDPLAAMSVGARGRGEELDPRTATYIEKQTRLIEIQSEHLHEQRAIQLSHLKIRRFTELLKAALQVFIVLVATVIGAAFLAMVLEAFTSHSVVVDVFRSPPALVSRGLTGDVVATSVLDGLQQLQDATRSPSKGLRARGAWASDIKIEVPETGVSLGELDRLLHERFGHDLHIEGELVQTETGGLSMTVRGEGVPAKTFEGGVGDVDTLVTHAAEYIYGRAEPLLYSLYLLDNKRFEDALSFLPGAFARAPDSQRADLAHSWAIALANLNKNDQSLAKDRLAMALAKPRSPVWWNAWSGILGGMAVTEEDSWRASNTFLAAAARAPRRQRPELRLIESDASNVRDYPLALKAELENASINGGAGVNTNIAGPEIAYVYMRIHDFAAADRYLAESDPDDNFTKAVSLFSPGKAALERGDAAGAIPALEANRAWVLNVLKYNPSAQGSEFLCYLGLAYSLTGRQADAAKVFEAAAGKISLCTALKGYALAHAGDLAGAKKVWAEGLTVGPDLPPIYLYRGQTELERGSLTASEADLRTANSRAPHWADPLKAWGDLLTREGRWKDALSKYDEALAYAPAWAQLHLARDAAARRN